MEFTDEEVKYLKLRKERILEEVFFLTLHTSMTFTELYHMPISYRKFFVHKLLDHIKAQNPETK